MTRSSIHRLGGVAVGVAGGAVIGALLFAPLTSLAQDDATESPDATTPSQQDDDDGPGMGGRGHGGHGIMMGEGLEVAAEALGVSEADLRTALQDGQSLADVAEAQGVDIQDLVDALVAAATERIDSAVDDGRIDEERAADLKADLPDRIADMVERTGLPGRGGHGPGGIGPGGMGPGGMGPGMCDDDATGSDDSSGAESSGLGSTSGTSATTAGVTGTGMVLMAV